MSRLVVVTLLAARLVAPAAAQTPPPAPALGTYALLGRTAVVLAPGVRVEAGAVGVLEGPLTLGRGVRVNGTAAADVIRMRAGSSARRLLCRFVRAAGAGAVAGPVVDGAPVPACRELPRPLVDAALLPPVQVVPGPSDLRVPRRTGTAPIAAGTFRNVVAGPGALLQLAGGTYVARSLRVARSARVVCLDACRIVTSRVRVAPGAQLGAEATLGAERVLLEVAGGGRAFSAGARATVAATVYAPAGRIVLGAGSTFRGAGVGRLIRVGRAARVRADSAL
jgi:hypothetical protein